MKKSKKTCKFSKICFIIIRWLIKVFYPKIKVVGTENLNNEATVFVGNHSQMNGPICAEIYPPIKCQTWCAYQMMELKEVPPYAFKDFWSNKPKYIRWFFKILSYIIAPISVCIFNNANTIPVYHDARLISTFKQTVNSLNENEGIIIFPECYDEYNNIVNRFQDRFIDVAKLYYKKTGKCINFVPMYIAPKLKTVYLGKPIVFSPEQPIELEREKICNYLMEEITKIAKSLPTHTVVPYANIPRKEYKTNI